MAKLHRITKAGISKKTRTCRVCQHQVQPGEGYKYMDRKTGPRSGYRLFFCFVCVPKPSHHASGRTQELMEITEGAEEAVGKVDHSQEGMEDLWITIEDVVSSINSLAEEIRDSANAIEDGFGHETQQSTNMSETADNLETWAGELEGAGERAEDIDNNDDAEELISEIQGMLGDVPELELTG